MDVALILTHRCNLACHYCYAGEHFRKEIDDVILRRGVELLVADGAQCAQLSFFGGEPFLAFEAMQRATQLAVAQAKQHNQQLLLQCTTNGTALARPEVIAFTKRYRLQLTVSIDGVRQAHELNRPLAGGRSSFDAVLAGLRALVAAGLTPDAMLVITPQTARYLHQSVRWLWHEGVTTVRANVELRADWQRDARDMLREQLILVGRELLSLRLRERRIHFQPFDGAIEHQLNAHPHRAPSCVVGHNSESQSRRSVVVATSGNLYPCAPMVAEDRDDGPEAKLRVGHLDQGAAAIVERLVPKGSDCGEKGCACAALLETGDRESGGPIGLWYGEICRTIGTAVGSSLARHAVRKALDRDRDDDDPLPPQAKARRRGPLVLTLGLLVGGIVWTVRSSVRTLGELSLPRLPKPPIEQTVITTSGAIETAPQPPPPPRPQPEGELKAPPRPPRPLVRGEINAPPPHRPPQPIVAGGLRPPPRTPPPRPAPTPQPTRQPTIDGDLATPPPPKVQLKTRGQLTMPPRAKLPTGR
ncbi:MAG: radical SAM protein [Deltaproteobacteria bacterium]|nr:radical SAM protein [Deltaproteobacteria bacterium]